MTILLNNQTGDSQPWADALAPLLPGLDIHIYPDLPDPEEIRYAVVWHHPHGDLPVSYTHLTLPTIYSV